MWIILFLSGFSGAEVRGEESWQSALTKMPLAAGTQEINHTNFAAVMLPPFKQNGVVKALILMPGSTDEFYFYRRAKVKLPAGPLNLLDAVTAITNQTHVRVLFRPPMLLLYTTEDPTEPLAKINHAASVERLKKTKYKPHFLYDDLNWDSIYRELSQTLGLELHPARNTTESWHFFRHSLAAYDLNGWETLEAISLAGKTTFTVSKAFLSARPKVVFAGDLRFGEPPPFK